MEIKRLILLGPQASGKSTQGKKIASLFKIPILTSGQILRDEISKNSDIGHQVAEYVNKGLLIPDGYMISMIEKELTLPKYSRGFLLDGFPRSIEQAKSLDARHSIDKVININISDQEAINRISGRRVCPHGHIYNIVSNPPAVAGICDVCEKPLSQRQDDQEEVIKKRLSLYHQETSPLIAYYKEKGKLLTLDGNKDIKSVFDEIVQNLSK